MLGSENAQKPNNFMFYVLLCIVLLAFVHHVTSTYSLVSVDGGSMNNTLVDGDVLFVKENAQVERGDIIVINHPENGMVIKRVIAMAGDVIKCEDFLVYLKKSGEDEFVALDEPYVSSSTPDFYEQTIGENEIFVMGDNRAPSIDSKIYGPIKADYVVGVVTEWSINNRNFVKTVFGWTFKFDR